MRIPPGTQSGRVFRLKGKGIPDIHSHAPADQLVKVQVEIPTRLNQEQRRAIEDFTRASGEQVNKESFSERIKKTFN